MVIPRSMHRWLRLPGRAALLLGLGALSVAGARADAPGGHQGAGLGDMLIRTEGGKIYLSEGGRETELRLTATPQRDHLLRLLEEQGPAGIKLDPDPRLIMSSGGGAGFYWWGAKKPGTDKPAPAPPETAPRSLPEQGSAPRDHNAATGKKG